MKQEDKKLLLKDLGARLPYSVKCKIALYKTAFNVLGIVEDKVKLDSPVYDEGDDWWEVTEIKPYLRPMSSMTEEEIKELSEIDQKRIIFSARHLTWHLDGEVIDYLNKKMFDWRGLIHLGIALKATKEMYGI